MIITLKLIVDYLSSKNIDFTVQGDNISVNNLAAIGPNVRESICYYVGDDPRSLTGIEQCILFCKPGIKLDPEKKNTYIFTKHPQLCFYHISSLFEEWLERGIHSQSVVDRSAIIGQNVSIGPFCTIEECMIGNNVIIESGVKVHKGTVIGNNVHIQANSVIGAIGVLWTWDVDGGKVPCVQTGYVIIEDNVFVGANVSISRGVFENRPTIIGRNTMISHGTMIGHGCAIGANNHLSGNVSLAGSVRTEKNCFLGMGATVRSHVKLPEETIVGTGGNVVKDFTEQGLILIGNPARKMNKKKDRQSGVPVPF